MKKYTKYTEMGLRAIKRAALKVHEDARKNNLKISIWKDGKVEYIEPVQKNIPELNNSEK
jgi:hypothetical protein